MQPSTDPDVVTTGLTPAFGAGFAATFTPARRAALARVFVWTHLALAMGVLAQAPMFGARLLLVATNLAVGVAFATAGALLADEDGQRANGVALGVAAVLWPVNWAGGWSTGPGAVADVVIGPFSPLLVIWALARYPKPWARRRDERAVIALLVSVQVWTLPMVLTSRPSWSGFKPGSWWWTVWPSRTVFDVSLVVNGIVGTLAAVGLGGLVVYRIRRLTGPDRSQTMPIAWAVAVTAAAWAASEVGWTLTSSPAIRYAFAETEEATMLGVPIAFVVVVLRRRLAGEAVTRFATRLGQATGPAAGPRGPSVAGVVPVASRAVSGAVRDALGDPTARVYFWAPAEESWVDAEGQPVDRSRVAFGRFTSEVFDAEGGSLALITGDEGLRRHPARVDAVTRAFALSLENARLQVAVGAEIYRETRSSDRAREVVMSEQRRIATEIRNGPGKRLDDLSNHLDGLLREVTDDPAAATLRVARDHLRASLRDLDALARGQVPPDLAEAGLHAAVPPLVDGIDPAVKVAVTTERFDPAIELAAYFVAAETVTNAIKHARCRLLEIRVAVEDDAHLAVEVSDDGVGGANPHGHGLAGLADRVHAIGGSLDVRGRPGGGTRVVARLPARAVGEN